MRKRRVVKVTPAQVQAAKTVVERKEARGQEPSSAEKLIADATPQEKSCPECGKSVKYGDSSTHLHWQRSGCILEGVVVCDDHCDPLPCKLSDVSRVLY